MQASTPVVGEGVRRVLAMEARLWRRLVAELELGDDGDEQHELGCGGGARVVDGVDAPMGLELERVRGEV